jgi:hypothetical protein
MPNPQLIPVPDFARSTVAEANATALEMHFVLTYYDRNGQPMIAPVADQWPNWMVVQNMPPTTVGFQIMPGGQVGVMITFVPSH